MQRASFAAVTSDSGTQIQSLLASGGRGGGSGGVTVIRGCFGSWLPLVHQIRVDCIVVEKCKTGPSLREDKRFYPEILGHLLKYIVPRLDATTSSEAIILTDRIPVNRKRQVIEKTIKETLASMLPKGMPYRILHHDSKSCCGLQVADYINWAIFRDVERNDSRSWTLVRPAIKSQFDIFRRGTMRWY
jgi:hypothetical protein